MSRFRPLVVAACFAVLLMGALPGAGMAQRTAGAPAGVGQTESIGDGLIDSVLAWGRGALSWLQAVIAAEHGVIAEITPPPTPEPVARAVRGYRAAAGPGRRGRRTQTSLRYSISGEEVLHFRRLEVVRGHCERTRSGPHPGRTPSAVGSAGVGVRSPLRLLPDSRPGRRGPAAGCAGAVHHQAAANRHPGRLADWHTSLPLPALLAQAPPAPPGDHRRDAAARARGESRRGRKTTTSRAISRVRSARLPDRCRSLLRLRYGLGCDDPEVADRMGYSPTGIRKIAHRCLSALTHQMLAGGYPAAMVTRMSSIQTVAACDFDSGLLGRFAEGETNAAERSKVLKHLLSGCDSCRAALAPKIRLIQDSRPSELLDQPSAGQRRRHRAPDEPGAGPCRGAVPRVPASPRGAPVDAPAQQRPVRYLVVLRAAARRRPRGDLRRSPSLPRSLPDGGHDRRSAPAEGCGERLPSKICAPAPGAEPPTPCARPRISLAPNSPRHRRRLT